MSDREPEKLTINVDTGQLKQTLKEYGFGPDRMTPTMYAELSMRTKPAPTQFYGDKVPRRILEGALYDYINAANRLDVIKKSLFYGRDNGFAWGQQYGTPYKELSCEGFTEEGIDTLHGVLGIATEAGELCEAFLKPPHDRVNLIEELGDVFWYAAVLAKRWSFTFEEVMETNVAKLRKRFGHMFTAEAANNRDLAAERRVLEGLRRPHPDQTSPMTVGPEAFLEEPVVTVEEAEARNWPGKEDEAKKLLEAGNGSDTDKV